MRKRVKSNLQFFAFISFLYSIHTFILFYLYFYRTIDHVMCTFNLPTEYNASGQEHIIDDEDKIKIKVDPMKMSLDGIEISQLEEIVEGWMKYITKILRESSERVRKLKKLQSN